MQITEVIQKTPGVCGGYACVRQTRIPVWTLVSFRDVNRVFSPTGCNRARITEQLSRFDLRRFNCCLGLLL